MGKGRNKVGCLLHVMCCADCIQMPMREGSQGVTLHSLEGQASGLLDPCRLAQSGKVGSRHGAVWCLKVVRT